MCVYLSGTRNYERTKSLVITERMKIYNINQLKLVVKHISEECGVSPPSQIDQVNTSENNYMTQVTPEETNFVRQLNEDDSKLYSYVTSRASNE